MNDAAYWIWLLRTLGPAAVLQDILQYFGSARGLYEAGSAEWRLSGLLTAKQITALTRFSPSQSADVLRDCAQNGWKLVTPDSLLYPARLRELRNLPPVLFVWGDETVLLREAQIAVVGTRKASAYGLRVASLLTEALAKSGMVVVSGGALGVDSAAHEGALRAGGKTIAVLGCGLGTDYLRENGGLRRRIAQNGAVISEFLPYAPASRTTFPLRNRVISALAPGTVVIEAGEHSGSLITARCAMEQGRDLFAVPGDVISSAFTGANRLIRDGAKPVFSPMDVLEEYLYRFPDELHEACGEKTFGELLRESGQDTAQTPHARSAERLKTEKDGKAPPDPGAPGSEPKALPDALSENARTVYRVLAREPKHIDVLSEEAGLPAAACLAALTELELYGCAELTEGRKYRKI